MDAECEDPLSTTEESSLLPSPSEQKLSTLQLLCLNSFAFSNGLCISTYFLITLPIEAARISVSAKSVVLGSLIALAGISQLVCPLVGLMSDACTLNLGRRRPFMIIGGLGCTVGLAAQWLASVYEVWALYAAAFFVSMLSLNMVYSAMISLVPDIVATPQIGAANGLQALLSVTGAAFGNACFYLVLDADVRGLYPIYLVTLLLTVGLTVCTTHETPLGLPPQAAESTRGAAGAAGDGERRLLVPLAWSAVRGAYYLSPVEHHDFFYVTLSRTLYYMGVSAQTFFLYFLKDIIQVEDPRKSVTLLSGIGQLSACVTAYPIGLLSDHFGQRRTFIYISCACLALGNLAFIFARSFNVVMIISGLVGLGNGAYMVTDSSLAMDTLPDKAASAKFLGIWGVASFVGTALGPMVGGPLLYLVGQTGQEGVYSIWGYASLLSFAFVYFVLAAVVLIKVSQN